MIVKSLLIQYLSKFYYYPRFIDSREHLKKSLRCVEPFQVASLMQLREEGIGVKPGNLLRYVITDHKSKNWETMVKVAELIDGSEEYDKEIYLKYLAKCGESLLSPFGYTQERLEEILSGLRQVGLDNWI